MPPGQGGAEQPQRLRPLQPAEPAQRPRRGHGGAGALPMQAPDTCDSTSAFENGECRTFAIRTDTRVPTPFYENVIPLGNMSLIQLFMDLMLVLMQMVMEW